MQRVPRGGLRGPPARRAGRLRRVLRERQELADRFIAALREEPESERRARLIAAASQLLDLVGEMQITADQSFAGVMYPRASILEQYERHLDAAAEKAGVTCAPPAEPSADLREFS